MNEIREIKYIICGVNYTKTADTFLAVYPTRMVSSGIISYLETNLPDLTPAYLNDVDMVYMTHTHKNSWAALNG